MKSPKKHFASQSFEHRPKYKNKTFLLSEVNDVARIAAANQLELCIVTILINN